jgi:cytochrome c-type biogenesis protein
VNDLAKKGAAMQDLFTQLTHAVEGVWFAAMAAAFLWGVLSIVLSPCHLAGIPLIVGFIEGQGRMTIRRAFAVSTAFSVGILITIALIGVVTAMAGRMLGSLGGWGNYLVAAIFFLVGLYLLDVIAMPFSAASPKGIRRKGILAALLLGLVFGVALGPCTFAYMAPMLAITFRLAATDAGYGVLLLAMYGIGHCSVIVFAGTFSEVIQRYLNWNESSKGSVVLKRICGLLVLFGGLYMLYIA